MRVLSILKPNDTASEEDIAQLRTKEEQGLWQLYTQGKIRELYFQPQPIKVVLVWEQDRLSPVDGSLTTFPMIAASLFRIERIHAGPWLPLEALFSQTPVCK